jgi:hypothetical protein
MDTRISPQEMFKYLEGEVTSSRAEDIESHLAECRDCRQSFEKLRALTRSIGEMDEELAEIDLVPDLHRAIAAEPEPARRWRLFPALAAVSVACLLAVAGTLVWMATRDTPRPSDAYRVKSAAPAGIQTNRWAGMHVYLLTAEGGTRPLEKKLPGNASLLFGYTNLGENPFSRLMIFAVDQKGSLFWFHPAYLKEGSDPVSIQIRPDQAGIELPEAVQHDFEPGPLVLYALFTRRPLRVSTIEDQISALRQAGVWAADRPRELEIQGAAQHILTTRVEP